MERRAALTNITDAEVMVIDVSRDRLCTIVCLLAQKKKKDFRGLIEFDSPLFMKTILSRVSYSQDVKS